MSNNHDSEIGNIPDNWNVVQITEVVKPEKGSIKIGPFGSQLKREFLVDEGIKVYGQENVFKKDYNLGNRFITNDRYNKLKTCELIPGDIIISMMGTIGFVDIVPNDIDKGIMDSHLLRIRIDENVIDRKFLLYALKSNVIQNQIDSLSVGTIMPGLSSRVIKMIRIPKPPLFEQRAIAGVLSSLDDKIDLLHRQNKTLESLAEALFRQWFVEGTKGGKFSCITELIDINPTRKLPKGQVAPYLEMANVSTTVFHPNDWYDREFTSGMKFVNGDTLIARITPCLENGKSTYVTFLNDGQVGWGSTEYLVFHSKGSLHPFFTYALAKCSDFRDYAEGCFEGSSGRQRVNVDHLTNYKIHIPEDSVIQEFNSMMEAVAPKLHLNFMQIRTLERKRDTLLPKLISGDIHIQYENTLEAT